MKFNLFQKPVWQLDTVVLFVFRKAWKAPMTPSIIENGFNATGICPYNPGVIPNEAFDHAELYETPDVEMDISTNTINDSQDSESIVPEDQTQNETILTSYGSCFAIGAISRRYI